MKYNYADVKEDTGFDLIPVGEYKAEVSKCVLSYTAQTGNEMWRPQLKIIENKEYDGRLVFDNWVFSDNPKAQARMKMIFKALGYDVTKPFEAEPEDQIGKKVMIQVKQGFYMKNGEKIDKNEIPFDGYSALTGASPAAPTINKVEEPNVEEIDIEEVPF